MNVEYEIGRRWEAGRDDRWYSFSGFTGRRCYVMSRGERGGERERENVRFSSPKRGQPLSPGRRPEENETRALYTATFMSV